MVGRFFSSFGYVVGFSILMSMFISFTMTPMLCSRFLKLEAGHGASKGGFVWRLIEGGFGRPGPGTTWARARIPLVAGETDSPLVRALTLADSASGVGSQLDVSKWLIINTDLTVALHRDPVGEWLCMAASLDASPGGSALCQATLADRSGEFGRALQTMLVDERD